MRSLFYFVVKIVGGKGVCILGYAKFHTHKGMQNLVGYAKFSSCRDGLRVSLQAENFGYSN